MIFTFFFSSFYLLPFFSVRLFGICDNVMAPVCLLVISPLFFLPSHFRIPFCSPSYSLHLSFSKAPSPLFFFFLIFSFSSPCAPPAPPNFDHLFVAGGGCAAVVSVSQNPCGYSLCSVCISVCSVCRCCKKLPTFSVNVT